MTKRKEAPLSCFQLKTCLFAVHHRPLFAIYSVRIKVELSWHVLGLLHRKCAPNDGLMVAIMVNGGGLKFSCCVLVFSVLWSYWYTVRLTTGLSDLLLLSTVAGQRHDVAT